MQNVLTLAGPNADVDAQVAKAVADGRPRLSLRYALGGEVASFQGVTYQQLRGGLAREAFPPWLPQWGPSSDKPRPLRRTWERPRPPTLSSR